MSTTPKFTISILAALLLGGCAAQRYKPAPINPAATAAQFEARSLSDSGLRIFEEKYLGRHFSAWPPQSWDLQELSLAALYFNPAIDMAQARLAASNGDLVTARTRPNPTIDLSPGIPSPYLMSVGLLAPIETGNKRGLRIQVAQHLDEAAQFDLADSAWTVVMGVRAALLNYLVALRNSELLQGEVNAQEDEVAILEQQLSVGESTTMIVNLRRMDLSTARLALVTANGQTVDAKAGLAAAIGIPTQALDSAHFSWPGMNAPPAWEPLPRVAMQRDAVVNRLDVRRSLAQYAATDAALKLEIAKQYPNFNVGPGYTYEEKNSFFTLSFSTALPIFDRNQGPIAVAEARRKEAAAAFLQIQTQAIERSDRALAAYETALKRVKEAQSLYDTQEGRVAETERAIRAGSDYRLSLDGAQIQLSLLAIARLDAIATAQGALGALENAVQRPLAPNDVLPINAASPALDFQAR